MSLVVQGSVSEEGRGREETLRGKMSLLILFLLEMCHSIFLLYCEKNKYYGCLGPGHYIKRTFFYRYDLDMGDFPTF